MNKDKEIQELLAKVKAAEKGEKLDLSSGEDLSVAVMNLISIEEHLFFTFGKTKKEGYLELLNQVREMRKGLLKKLIKDYEGEEWCLSKHLLAGSMRLLEVGTKSLSKGDKKEAKEYFQMAHSLYELFWGLNLKLLKTGDLEKTVEKEIENDSTHSFMAKLGEVIKKAIDCCRE
ncbi:MAG TPA: hypothetical protein VMW04_02240 [Patescibacteria group bacterium]|nr:hypothetical protein [Patescibacteria group bacterium]